MFNCLSVFSDLKNGGFSITSISVIISNRVFRIIFRFILIVQMLSVMPIPIFGGLKLFV